MKILRLTAGIDFLSIPDEDAPSFVQDKKISIKTLCENFCGTLSHGLVARPFLAVLNLFLGDKDETSKNPLSEIYYNLT